MDSAALLTAIEDLLGRPLPGSGQGGSGQGYDLVNLTAGECGPALLNEVVATLRSRFGPPKTVAADGFTDPSLRRLPGPPLADLLVGHAIEMYGWTIKQTWLGVGLLNSTTDDDLTATTAVSLVAVRAPLSPVRPTRSSWAAELAALTGWSGDRRVVDWPSVERKLGLRLPRDYKQLAETFGAGTFDDDTHLCAPGSHHLDLDLIIADRAEFAEPAPPPQPTFRFLQWAMTEAEHSFCWLVEDSDPEQWPVFARVDSLDPWERFDCTCAEFIYRMLTDPYHPYTLAKHFETHWFTSLEQAERAKERAKEALWDDFHPHP